MVVVIRRWAWLETIGVVSGCFPHITYISLLHLYLLFFAAASLLLFSFLNEWVECMGVVIIYTVLYIYNIYIFFDHQTNDLYSNSLSERDTIH